MGRVCLICTIFYVEVAQGAILHFAFELSCHIKIESRLKYLLNSLLFLNVESVFDLFRQFLGLNSFRFSGITLIAPRNAYNVTFLIRLFNKERNHLFLTFLVIPF